MIFDLFVEMRDPDLYDIKLSSRNDCKEARYHYTLGGGELRFFFSDISAGWQYHNGIHLCMGLPAMLVY